MSERAEIEKRLAQLQHQAQGMSQMLQQHQIEIVKLQGVLEYLDSKEAQGPKVPRVRPLKADTSPS